jgi:phosphopantothenoylcysteine decarboxylase/phosphopantothenate--cysteine ligase
MGFDIAISAANLGASVILVSGPTNCKVSNPLIQVINVVSAQKCMMLSYVYNDIDVAIAAAAVADYRLKNVYQTKNKRQQIIFQLNSKNEDILSLGERKINQF